MKKSFFNRFLLGIAAAVLATGFASAQAKDPTFMKTASSSYPRLALLHDCLRLSLQYEK